MIPADLASRLRMLNEASFFNTDQPVAGLNRTREIQSQLPDLVPGDRILATLQRMLPDGTFRALVAGQQLTLALNHAASAGDTLELVVTQTTPKAVFAQLANPAAASNPSSQPVLSQTGRLISFLLTGQPAADPAALAANRPLLAAPPHHSAGPLVSAMRQALSQSGLFYESHQAQWIAGKIDTATLLREPQAQAMPQPAAGQAATAPQQQQAAVPQAATTQAATAQAAATASPRTNTEPVRLHVTGSGSMPAGEIESGRHAAAASQLREDGVSTRPGPIPERILPILHQQLDSLGTHQYFWQGQVWPGQHLEWVIEDPRAGEREGDGSEELADWNTTLRLTLPRLGGLEAQLHLTPAGIAVRLRADDAEAISALESKRPELEEALAAANMALTGMVVERRDGNG